MSCDACERFQNSDQASFFRWKNANIEIRGCLEHLGEVFEALRRAQRAPERVDITPVGRRPDRSDGHD